MNNFTTSFRGMQAVLLNATDTFFREFALYAPKILGALIIIILGFIIASVLRSITRTVLRWVGFAKIADKTELDLLLTKMSITRSPSSMVASIVYWVVVLIFLMAAFDTLGLTAVTATLRDLLAYIPNVVAAAITLVIALLLGRFVRKFIIVGLEQFGIKFGNIAATVAQGFIILFGAVIAATQLGLDVTIITANISIVIAGIMLAFALAFGLGSKSLAGNMASSYYTKQLYSKGKKVNLCGHSGTVKEVTMTSVVLDVGGSDTYIPNEKAISRGSITCNH